MPPSPEPAGQPDPLTSHPRRRLSTPPPDEPSFRARLTAALAPAYELGEPIGQGGFGRVYVARDVRLGRTVAIKTVRPDFAGAESHTEQFRREGSALARLRHPGVVPIYDIREVDGLIYHVMPLIVGESLRKKLQTRGSVPPKVAFRILSELGDAVSATHRAGLVHRDIKPDNIILEGRHEKVLLVDFGIAQIIESPSDAADGLWAGTPTYMAPEQLAADGIADERSDLYALGAIGYHLLTGRPPFESDSPTESMRRRLTEKVTPIRSINPSVPMLFADVMEQCLERDPLDRYESVAEMLSQLQHVTFVRDAGSTEEYHEAPVLGLATYILSGLALAAGVSSWLGPRIIELVTVTDAAIAAAGLLIATVLSSPRLRQRYSDWRRARTG
jgi:serine/threonine protein kinase